jgi:lantibiotic modifying enzyme
VLALARQCGERLLATAVPTKSGLGWAFADTGVMPLCGFSHGAAGMAAMLQQLTAVTRDPKFASAARQAIAYERSVFSAQYRNWPDFRGCHTQGETQTWSAFMTTWCHGAPGVGLGRLLIWPFVQDEAIHQEVETAVHTTIREGFGFNHCLCHGDLGNLELLTLAAETLGRAEWRAQRDELASAVLHSIRQGGWQCGTPLGVESPGLMTGIAGIGYGLLRLANPQAMPSILTLEPPKRR